MTIYTFFNLLERRDGGIQYFTIFINETNLKINFEKKNYQFVFEREGIEQHLPW